MREALTILRRTLSILGYGTIGGNHGRKLIRPGNCGFMSEFERVRSAGFNAIAPNVSFDVISPTDALVVLDTYRHFHNVLANSVVAFEAVKTAARLPHVTLGRSEAEPP
jgi:hypothetical protein